MISSEQVLQGTSAETVFEGNSQGMPLNSTPLNRSIEKAPGSRLSQGKSPGQSKQKFHLVKSLPLSEKNRRLTYVAQTKEQRTEKCDVFAKVCSELNGSLMDAVNSVNCFDSREAAKLVFQALISPTTEEHFFQLVFSVVCEWLCGHLSKNSLSSSFRTLWEKKPAYLMKRGNDYHKGVFSTAELYRILREVSSSKLIDIPFSPYGCTTYAKCVPPLQQDNLSTRIHGVKRPYSSMVIAVLVHHPSSLSLCPFVAMPTSPVLCILFPIGCIIPTCLHTWVRLYWIFPSFPTSYYFQHELLFTRNVDITTYIDGKRETHNPVGRAHAYTVQEYLQVKAR